jgi:hypothetical protein
MQRAAQRVCRRRCQFSAAGQQIRLLGKWVPSPVDENDPRASPRKRPMTALGMLAFDYKEEVMNSTEGIAPKGDTSAWELLANHKIRQAIEAGELDNLPGHGKPLSAEQQQTDYSHPEALGNKLLKNAGLTPAWIQDSGAIDTAVQLVRADLAAAWGKAGHDHPAWVRACAAVGEEVQELNKKIDRFNLSVPVTRLQKHRLSADKEVRRAHGQE